MSRRKVLILMALIAVSLLPASGCSTPNAGKTETAEEKVLAVSPGTGDAGEGMNITTGDVFSDEMQMAGVAFSAFTYLTGNMATDSFFLPEQTADYFGLQYFLDANPSKMDSDESRFSQLSANVLNVLTDPQKRELSDSVKKQLPFYKSFAEQRYPLLQTFRMEGKSDTNLTEPSWDSDALIELTKKMYEPVAEISLLRAETAGRLIRSLSQEQQQSLSGLATGNSNRLPEIGETDSLKKQMEPLEYSLLSVAAAELLTWHLGNTDADVYFSPTRYGVHFGTSYMNEVLMKRSGQRQVDPETIRTMGRQFIDQLSEEQRKSIREIVALQKPLLLEIAGIRRKLSVALRRTIAGDVLDASQIKEWIGQLGEKEGTLADLYASRFRWIAAALSGEQKKTLAALAGQTDLPKGAFYFDIPVEMPEIPVMKGLNDGNGAVNPAASPGAGTPDQASVTPKPSGKSDKPDKPKGSAKPKNPDKANKTNKPKDPAKKGKKQKDNQNQNGSTDAEETA